MNTKPVLLLAALALLPTLGRAQSAPAKPQVASACPSADYRFKPKTEKAKAVAAYCDARQSFRAAAKVGGAMTVLAVLANNQSFVSRTVAAYNDALNAMLAARSRAADLGGLKVENGIDVDHDVVKYTLTEGVDYTLKAD